MIAAREAVRVGRTLLGTPYARLDCIALIVRIVRRAAGGKPGYRCAGTNSLWRSYDSAPKYRDLTWRGEGIAGALPGMLAFKRTGSDVHHVGLVTGEGRVLHASSEAGRTVETALDGRWSLLARHRLIAVDEGMDEGAAETDAFDEGAALARVATQRDPLRVRSAPVDGEVLGSLPKGALVELLSGGDWPLVRRGALTGYASGAYLERL